MEAKILWLSASSPVRVLLAIGGLNVQQIILDMCVYLKTIERLKKRFASNFYECVRDFFVGLTRTSAGFQPTTFKKVGCTKGVSTKFIIALRKVFPESLWTAATLYLFIENITSKTPLQEWLKYEVKIISEYCIVEKEDSTTMPKDDTPQSVYGKVFFWRR